MEINIAFGATSDWLKYTRITIASILKHAKPEDNYNFYILCNDYNDKYNDFFHMLDKIKQANYIFYKMDDSEYSGFTLKIGACAYYRIKLSSITDKEKMLYMDSDIICEKDIAEIYDIDITDYYIAAVEDILGKHWATKIGFDANEEKYYNSGVLLMNLKRFREDNLEEKMFKQLRDKKDWWDQDVINYVCRNRVLSLPIKYNCMPSEPHRVVEEKAYICYSDRLGEYNDALIYPHLIHYTYKPWAFIYLLHAEKWFKTLDLVDNLYD